MAGKNDTWKYAHLDTTEATMTTADQRPLKPCPFCGSTNVDPEGWASTERSGPACDDCAGSADTVELWNNRPLAADAASPASGGETFDFDVFERATDIMAMWLARFRDEEAEPTDNDRLTAGHLAGALAANRLLASPAPAVTEEAPVEIRRNPDESIDEIVAKNCFVHVEQMDDCNWYMGIEASDGSNWQFWFGAKNGRSHVEFRHTEMTPAAMIRGDRT